MPAIDAVLTIWPPSPWARICGRKALDAVQHAHQIDVDHPSPIVERDVVDAAAGGDAGIVADHMDLAERLERRLRGALDARRIGDIADDAADVGRDLLQAFDGGLQRVRLDIGQHHFHAGLRKGPAERKPDACRHRRSQMLSCRRSSRMARSSQDLAASLLA